MPGAGGDASTQTVMSPTQLEGSEALRKADDVEKPYFFTDLLSVVVCPSVVIAALF